MKESEQHRISRRNVLKGSAGLALTALYGGTVSGQDEDPPASGNLIAEENAKPGTQDWRLTNTSTVPGKVNDDITSGRSPAVEGYCSANSVRAGDSLKIMVSTNPVSAFKLEIFRTGYYNGDGGRLMRTYDALPGVTQLDPAVGESYLRECQWDPSVEFDIPADWISGVYLGKLTAASSGLQSYVIFIVRDDRPCDLLFQCSELTWSAYNRWPVDYAAYTKHTEDWSSTAVPSGTVSFDRPYSLFTHPVNKITNSGGSGEFLPWEFPLSFWLEQHGYDVSYISNIDTHSDRDGLLRAKGFISVGHDEYWTQDMFDNVRNARDEGVSLAFLCGNSALCKVPLLHSTDGRPNRAIRREGWFLPVADGQQFPPSMLNEEGFEPNMGPDGALLLGARHPIGQGVGAWVRARAIGPALLPNIGCTPTPVCKRATPSKDSLAGSFMASLCWICPACKLSQRARRLKIMAYRMVPIRPRSTTARKTISCLMRQPSGGLTACRVRQGTSILRDTVLPSKARTRACSRSPTICLSA